MKTKTWIKRNDGVRQRYGVGRTITDHPRIRGWEKTGMDVPPRFQYIHGKVGSEEVIWIDNWQRGDWAVIIGREHSSEGQSAEYEEVSTITNVSSKADAIKEANNYMAGKANNSIPKSNGNFITLKDNFLEINLEEI